MDRADRNGLALAIVGHGLLFAVLTIGISRRPPPPSVQAPPMDVQLVDTVGAQSASPEPATEPPQQQTAPDSGPPEEAPPPAPTPEPTPTPPVAQPKTTPAPPKLAPVPPKPAPAPIPSPKPVKEKPQLVAKAEAPAKPTKPTQTLGADLLKDLRAAARAEGKGATDGKGQRTTANRVGADFLKGVVNPTAGKGKNARAALTGPQMNGLGAAIKRQVQPCYDLGGLGGTPAMQIVTVLQLRFNKDGSVQGTPQLVEQQGVTAANRSYARQMEDVSRRAILRCAPLKLPAELYEGGWENITMGFIPGQMQ